MEAKAKVEDFGAPKIRNSIKEFWSAIMSKELGAKLLRNTMTKMWSITKHLWQLLNQDFVKETLLRKGQDQSISILAI